MNRHGLHTSDTLHIKKQTNKKQSFYHNDKNDNTNYTNNHLKNHR